MSENFSVMITDWEANFTDLLANDFGNLGKNNSGNLLVGNHAVIFTEINSHRLFLVGNVCVDNGKRLNRTLDGQKRQSPIASVQRTRPTLAGHSAVPRGTNTTPMNANRVIRIAAPRTQGL